MSALAGEESAERLLARAARAALTEGAVRVELQSCERCWRLPSPDDAEMRPDARGTVLRVTWPDDRCLSLNRQMALAARWMWAPLAVHQGRQEPGLTTHGDSRLPGAVWAAGEEDGRNVIQVRPGSSDLWRLESPGEKLREGNRRVRGFQVLEAGKPRTEWTLVHFGVAIARGEAPSATAATAAVFSSQGLTLDLLGLQPVNNPVWEERLQMLRRSSQGLYRAYCRACGPGAPLPTLARGLRG